MANILIYISTFLRNFYFYDFFILYHTEPRYFLASTLHCLFKLLKVQDHYADFKVLYSTLADYFRFYTDCSNYYQSKGNSCNLFLTHVLKSVFQHLWVLSVTFKQGHSNGGGFGTHTSYKYQKYIPGHSTPRQSSPPTKIHATLDLSYAINAVLHTC